MTKPLAIASRLALLAAVVAAFLHGRVVHGRPQAINTAYLASLAAAPGFEPGTDICTNCPDPAPNPPVQLPQAETFEITVLNKQLPSPNPAAYCELYESTNWPPTFVPVASEPYDTVNMFYRTETAAECFWTARNGVWGITSP